VEFAGDPDIDFDPNLFFDCYLKSCQIEKTGMRSFINQDVKVAAIDIIPMQCGAKQARVCHAEFFNQLPNRFAMLRKDIRRLHGVILA